MSVASVVTGVESVPARSKVVTRNGNVATISEEPLSNLTARDTMGKTFNVPDYSIKDILSAIPKHCYERSLIRSMGYVVRDIAAMLTIGYLGHKFIPMVQLENEFLAKSIRFALWSFQSYAIGLFGFGLWILAHECGHGAFSDYPVVNDFVGWVLHSYLIVPYFSWKFSHSKHHKATGHLTRDTVFVPYTKENYLQKHNVVKASELVEETPISTFSMLIFQQLAGLQFYLATNATGQPHPEKSWYSISHYAPNAPVFDPHQYWYVILADIGIICTFTGVYQWYKNFGLFSMMINWFVPWLWVNHWLVFVTFLQHTDSTMPHYSAKQWTFARGAAATIDRDFGFIGQHIFHDIIETHVLHHYVSRIPFYNAREASAAIQKVMGEHYRYQGENMWVSLWKCLRMCQFVEDEKDEGVFMFRNSNNIGIKAQD